MKLNVKIYKYFWPVLLFVFSLFLWSQQQYSVDDAPGPLSPAHKDSPGLKNCTQCHSDELVVIPQKCLACHQEIALRISDNRGYHRDKAEDCAACHTEHEGEETRLMDLDIHDFDHEETGHTLLGKHKTITDCFKCHREENSFPRKITHSYLMEDSRCLSCHVTPHPGHQDSCQFCHSQNNWRVDIWAREVR